MTRGRKRKMQPGIPAHIDLARIPKGMYWDRTGNGRWFILVPAGDGRVRYRTVATRDARLSDLHRVAEEFQGIDRTSLAWLLDQFLTSETFKKLAPGTQSGYVYMSDVAKSLPTKLGKPLGDLTVARMTPPLIQRMVDTIASQGTPTKANQILRLLRRVFHWGVNRGHCQHNPARGIEQAKERKRRRLPTTEVVTRIVEFARTRGAQTARTEGAVPPYLWIAMEIAYLCRLRGIEVVTLSDANATEEGVLTNRRKGSRDNIVRWTPRLRSAWDAAVAIRTTAFERTRRPSPIKPDARALFVSEGATPLDKSSLDTSWQRLMRLAVEKKVITTEQRFGLHDLKRKGVTDTPGNRADKREASGHKSEAMMDVYDLSLPTVDTPEKQ